jgi:hypothetical protein
MQGYTGLFMNSSKKSTHKPKKIVKARPKARQPKYDLDRIQMAFDQAAKGVYIMPHQHNFWGSFKRILTDDNYEPPPPASTTRTRRNP